MYFYDNTISKNVITIIGTGHVFDVSKFLEQKIEEINPDIICLELDQYRYMALKSGNTNVSVKTVMASKNIPFVYKSLVLFQSFMGKRFGADAGKDMLSAINIAEENNIPLAFIDMDARTQILDAWNEMSFSGKFKFVISLIFSGFVSKKRIKTEIENAGKKSMKTSGMGNSFTENFMEKILHERDRYMSSRIKELAVTYKNIVAIVGDMHVSGIKELLEKGNALDSENAQSEMENMKSRENGAFFSVEYSHDNPDHEIKVYRFMDYYKDF